MSYNIYHFMPFAVDKDYCKEINRYVSIVPNDEDWICIWDGDTCRTISTWGSTIKNAIDKNSDFDVLTGTTTRVGGGVGNPQKMYGHISYETNMVKLHNLCLKHENKYRDLQAIEVKRSLPGFLIMFRKKLWKEFSFDSDMTNGGVLDWDTNWFRKVLKAGKRVGIVKGISVYHHYRLHKKRKDETHLK